jgi:hypothetical protein
MPVMRRVVGAWRGANWSMTMAIVSGVTACAPGSAGLVSGDVLEADGARVIVVRGYGLQLRGAPMDAGLTVGYARRTYVYPNTTPELPSPGRYYFWVPQPATAPVAWDSRAIGLDLRVTSPAVGVTLGFWGSSVLARVPAGETVFYRLRFLPDEPASTRLRYCEGDDACSNFGSLKVEN